MTFVLMPLSQNESTAPSMHARRLYWLVGGFMLAVVCGSGAADAAIDPPEVVPVGIFSEMDASQELPVEWRPLSLASARKKTEYDLVETSRGVVVRAHSDESISALGTDLRVDLTEHPILKWHWKVADIVEAGDARVTRKEDLPARIIVSFAKQDLSLGRRLKLVAFRALGYSSMPRQAIVYSWANRAERHAVIPAHAGWIKQVIVQSGRTHVGTWQTERRNVREDYRAIFGEAPPPIESISLMTDTEHTDSRVTAYYGDIVLMEAPADSASVDTTLSIRR